MNGDVPTLLAVVALTAVLALWARSRQGRVTASAGETFLREAVGAAPGTTLLVAFTAPSCAPCTEAHAVLRAATQRRDDVVLVTADVGEHPELARTHRVLRAPTTLVVDVGDQVRHRISGVPSADAVADVLDAARGAAAT